jgi:hypothetical protein
MGSGIWYRFYRLQDQFRHQVASTDGGTDTAVNGAWSGDRQQVSSLGEPGMLRNGPVNVLSSVLYFKVGWSIWGHSFQILVLRIGLSHLRVVTL